MWVKKKVFPACGKWSLLWFIPIGSYEQGDSAHSCSDPRPVVTIPLDPQSCSHDWSRWNCCSGIMGCGMPLQTAAPWEAMALQLALACAHIEKNVCEHRRISVLFISCCASFRWGMVQTQNVEWSFLLPSVECVDGQLGWGFCSGGSCSCPELGVCKDELCYPSYPNHSMILYIWLSAQKCRFPVSHAKAMPF